MTDVQKAKIRIVTEITPFLKRNANSKLKIGLPLVVFSYGFLWFISMEYSPIHIDLGKLAAPVYFLVGIVFCYGLTQFIVPAKYYYSGLNGELKVVDNISTKLGSVHYMFNDIKLKDRKSGNIDHVIVGPRGIFVIETKNIRNATLVNESCWKPGAQAINNAIRIRTLLENVLEREIPYVQAVVVLTNPKVKVNQQIESKDYKVILMKDTEDTRLRDYILSFEPTFFSADEIDEIIYCIDTNRNTNF